MVGREYLKNLGKGRLDEVVQELWFGKGLIKEDEILFDTNGESNFYTDNENEKPYLKEFIKRK